ncbi:MAG: hypothetical protein PHR85_14305 [Malikia sp.]|nr:hypothetical protein [Malikia sp.]MDD2730315.1 hypothetical protein [Malikia sp.]
MHQVAVLDHIAGYVIALPIVQRGQRHVGAVIDGQRAGILQVCAEFRARTFQAASGQEVAERRQRQQQNDGQNRQDDHQLDQREALASVHQRLQHAAGV